MKKYLLLLPVVLLLAFVGWHLLYSYRRYNVILITTDTLRADYLSCYNPDTPKTANFDRLAGESVMFENAYTTIPITLAAHAAILTSHSPHNLGVFNNGETYDGRYTLISELLTARGYHTGAFISLGVLKGEFGLGSAFQYYQDQFDERLGRFYKTADEVNAVALPWIEQEKDHPFFAWIHYSDPHEPYVTVDAPPDTEVLVNGTSYGKYCLAKKEKIRVNLQAPPGVTKITLRALAGPGPQKIQEAESQRYLDPKLGLDAPKTCSLTFNDEWEDIHLSNGSSVRYFDGEASFEIHNSGNQTTDALVWFTGGLWNQRIEEVRENYEAEVQFLDRYLGILLDRLQAMGLMDRTIIVLTSDHGEGLKTHGYLGHVGNLHNEVIHVPLLFYYPNLGRPGIRNPLLVNHLDIMPTLLDMLHLKSDRPLEGASLMRYVSRSPLDRLLAPKVGRLRTYVETYAPEAPRNSFAMVEGDMKLIFTPSWKWEIYDTGQDEMEKRNIVRVDEARFESAPVAKLCAALEDFSKESERAHGQRKNPQLDESQKEMLHVLGYVNQGENPKEPAPASSKPNSQSPKRDKH